MLLEASFLLPIDLWFNVLVYLFNKYLLSFYYTSETNEGAENMTIKAY